MAKKIPADAAIGFGPEWVKMSFENWVAWLREVGATEDEIVEVLADMMEQDESYGEKNP
jgi:hypothetical protein